MPQIVIDLESARSIADRLRINVDAIQYSVAEIDRAMAELERDWKGRRALRVALEYEEVRAKRVRLAELYEDLRGLELMIYKAVADFDEAITSS